MPCPEFGSYICYDSAEVCEEYCVVATDNLPENQTVVASGLLNISKSNENVKKGAGEVSSTNSMTTNEAEKISKTLFLQEDESMLVKEETRSQDEVGQVQNEISGDSAEAPSAEHEGNTENTSQKATLNLEEGKKAISEEFAEPQVQRVAGDWETEEWQQALKARENKRYGVFDN